MEKKFKKKLMGGGWIEKKDGWLDGYKKIYEKNGWLDG